MVRISAWWTRRSMRAVAVAALGKMVGHSLNGRLVVSARLRRSYLRLTTWKSRSAARAS
jgi:preprotein translocase subunit SecF